MKFAILGAGGTGGVLGGYLANAGNDVTFIARGKHLSAMQNDGLTIRTTTAAIYISHPSRPARPQTIKKPPTYSSFVSNTMGFRMPFPLRGASPVPTRSSYRSSTSSVQERSCRNNCRTVQFLTDVFMFSPKSAAPVSSNSRRKSCAYFTDSGRSGPSPDGQSDTA